MSKKIQALIIFVYLGLKVFLIYATISNILSYNQYIFLTNPVVSFIFYFLANKHLPIKKRYIGISIVVEIFIPFFGIFLILGSIILYFILKSLNVKSDTSKLIDDFHEGAFDSGPHKESFPTENHFFQSKNIVNAMPYFDIIKSGDLKLKLTAIEKASHIRSTASIEILKLALYDSAYEVKYMAKNCLEKIETTLMNEVEIASEVIKHNPRNYRSYNFRANLYAGIEYLKIFDNETNLFFIHKCIDDLTSSLKLEPVQPDAFVKMASALVKAKLHDRAIQFIDHALKQDLSEIKKIKLLFFKSECFFCLRDFPNTKEHLAKINPNRISFQNIKTSIETWSMTSHERP